MEVGIGVTCKGKRRETSLAHRYREFLAQFPYQGIFRSLAILDFAAGEFPETGHRLALRSLRDQDAAVGVDERAGGDKNKFDAHSPRPR